MATLEEQLANAEAQKDAAIKRAQELRRKIRNKEAREKREKEKREREQLLATQQEVGAFVIDYPAPWLSSKTFTAKDGYGNETKCSVWDKFRAEMPEEISIPNVLTAGE